MDNVARLPEADRADIFKASAARMAFNVVAIEKDFWVCWILKRLFALPDPPAGLVFKGGTSLSKVYGAIDRFSEDVDVSLDRSDLGFGGQHDPVRAPSKKKRQASVKELVSACRAMIREKLMPQLEAEFSVALGVGSGDSWRVELDPEDRDEQTVLFHYPASGLSSSGKATGYLRPFVRLEIGARGEHWPNEEASVQPYAAQDVPEAFETPDGKVKVIAAERTFWEKATILHMWHHAPADREIGGRQSRHYYDVVRLYQCGIGERALADLDLLLGVALHKAVFFPRAWAKYHEAAPGSLRLVLPETRRAELERDYAKMQAERFSANHRRSRNSSTRYERSSRG